jgi:hypothetical protein
MPVGCVQAEARLKRGASTGARECGQSAKPLRVSGLGFFVYLFSIIYRRKPLTVSGFRLPVRSRRLRANASRPAEARQNDAQTTARLDDMRDMLDLSLPLQGMQSAVSTLNSTAERVARMPVSSQNASNSASLPVDQADLSTEAVHLLTAKNDFAANTKAFHAMDEMTRATLDLIK